MLNNRKSMLLIFVICLISAGLIYCGGGGDGGSSSTTPTGPSAFNFDQANMVEAASIAAADSGLYFPLTGVILQTITALSGTGGMSTAAVIPIGDIGICSLGTGTADWNDADGNLALSVGDSATLTLTDCQFESTDIDTINGTLTLTFVAVSPTLDDITADVSLDVTISDGVRTDNFNANFLMQATTTDMVNYVISITAQDSNDVIIVKLNGQTLYRFGCFDVELTLNILIEDTFVLKISGVTDVSGRGIMSLAAIVNQPLSFVPGPVDPYADSGIMNIVSIGECAALGVPDGVDDSDGNFIRLIALGGGDVQLELFDGSVPPNLLTTINTTWDDLD